MGVTGIDTLSAEEHASHVDAASLNQEAANKEAAEQRNRIAESDAAHATSDREVFVTRAEVEERFAQEREDIDAKYARKVEAAEEQRKNQHSRNLEKKQDAMARVGLNPDGSNPHNRPQAVVDRDTRRVIEASV